MKPKVAEAKKRRRLLAGRGTCGKTKVGMVKLEKVKADRNLNASFAALFCVVFSQKWVTQTLYSWFYWYVLFMFSLFVFWFYCFLDV